MINNIDNKNIKIDVVIPSYKPDEKLCKLIEALRNQTVLVNKVIIMNTEQKYFNLELEAYKEVEVHHISIEEFDHGKTRNEGISYSDADICVLMTQDAVPADNRLIEALRDALQEDECIAAAYARQLPLEKSSLSEKFTRGFNYPDEPRVKTADDIKTLGIKAFFCSNVCAAYKRDIFDELGGFVNEAVFNEDMVYAHKLLVNGYKIKYEPKAKVFHTHEYTGMQQYRRNFDLAVSQAMNKDVFDGVSSESEGVKYVISALKYFIKNGHPMEIFPFVIKCGYKYIGYKQGKNFQNMPMEKVLRKTSSKEFFRKYYRKSTDK